MEILEAFSSVWQCVENLQTEISSNVMKPIVWSIPRARDEFLPL